MNTTPQGDEVDVVVVGSGVAGAVAALKAASSGLRVLMLEKAEVLGGTSAMSSGGAWIPANRLAVAAGLDSQNDAIDYFLATAPENWERTDKELWKSFVTRAPEMLTFVEHHTELKFELIKEPDPFSHCKGGKEFGRMLQPNFISPSILKKNRLMIRKSTLPHVFSYWELKRLGEFFSPKKFIWKNIWKLLGRLITRKVSQGSALMIGLLESCIENQCEIKTAARAERLFSGNGARIDGVQYSHRGQTHEVVAKYGVVLATGGFEWNKEMRETYFPGPVDRCASPPTNEGDGQRMAAAAGALLDRMDQANMFATVPVRYENRILGLPAPFHAHPNAIIVNADGDRFVNEYDYNIGYKLNQRNGKGILVNQPAWVVTDCRFMRGAWAKIFRWYARKEPGWLKKADSIEDLANTIGVPIPSLLATVNRFNHFSETGTDEEFRRGESPWDRFVSGRGPSERNNTIGGIEFGPFFAYSFNRSFIGTKGGARTDRLGRVLRKDGTIIHGLYCAGNAMANPIGSLAIGAGSTIGPCMTWGYICASTICEEARSHNEPKNLIGRSSAL